MANKVSIRDARASFATIINQSAFAKDRFILTKNGKSVVAIIPVEDLELIEALEMKIDLAEARKRLAKPGKTVGLGQLKKDLGL